MNYPFNYLFIEDKYAPIDGNEFEWGGYTYKVIVRDYGVNGKLAWLDRNLGAYRPAQTYDDASSFGDYYQWGRLTDGHEKQNSVTTTTKSTTDVPGHGDFIRTDTYSFPDNQDWRDPRNDYLWYPDTPINNPCPPGWRVPRQSELSLEFNSWDLYNNDPPYDQPFVLSMSLPLKIPVAGYRDISGSMEKVGVFAIYGTSETQFPPAFPRTSATGFTSEDYLYMEAPRAYAFPIRSVRTIPDPIISDFSYLYGAHEERLLVGGYFTAYQGQTNNHIIALNPSDGSKDTSFDNSTGFSGIGKSINSIVIQNNGKILVGGDLSEYQGQTNNYIIRLNPDGSKDTSFDSSTGFNSGVSIIATQNDKKILVGGAFTTYQGQPNKYIIRLNPNGSKDTSFDSSTGFNSGIETIVTQNDGKILIGGEFTTYQGQTNNRIIRLNPDGSKDTSFDSSTGFNSGVSIIATQNDGKILVGGNFTTYQGQPNNYIIRLNPDGSKDTSFDSSIGFNSSIRTIVTQNDKKILVGGIFTTYQGQTNNYIIRLNSNGSKDTSFDSSIGFNNWVYTIVIQNDEKILVGGQFTTYQGQTNNRIIRLNPNGSKDTSFDSSTGFNDMVYAIASARTLKEPKDKLHLPLYKEAYFTIENKVTNTGNDANTPPRQCFDNGAYVLYRKGNSLKNDSWKDFPIHTFGKGNTGRCLTDVMVRVFPTGHKMFLVGDYKKFPTVLNPSVPVQQGDHGDGVGQLTKTHKYFIDIVSPHVPDYNELMTSVEGSASPTLINGNYIYDGSFNGKSRYKKDGSNYWILWDNGFWLTGWAFTNKRTYNNESGLDLYFYKESSEIKGQYEAGNGAGSVIVS